MRFYILIIFTSYGVFGHNGTFPPNFLFGLAQSAFQVEGAWNIDGKKESIWDTFVHENRSRIYNRDTADVACDSYHLYKEDIRLAAAVGANMYRFSISWPRVLPNGDTTNINERGLQYYERVLNEVRRHHMVPVVTIHHWDLPQALMNRGIHWTNPKLVDYFVDFARIVISRLRHVDYWVTINEPRPFCRFGYGLGQFPPGIESSGKDEYTCIYTMIKAHAAVYRMYKREFPHYKGKMSLAYDIKWYQPKNASSVKDVKATIRGLDFDVGLYVHPVFLGGWPPEAEKRIAERSRLANLTTSRLPAFSPEEIEFIKGTFDFFGVNIYTGSLIENLPEYHESISSYEADVHLDISFHPNWTDRASYFANYFDSILCSMYDHDVKIIGLTIWSLLDDFEWTCGYGLHFGIYYVDMDDPRRTRYPKMSSVYVNQLTRHNRLPDIDSIEPLYTKMVGNVTTDLKRIHDKVNSKMVLGCREGVTDLITTQNVLAI